MVSYGRDMNGFLWLLDYNFFERLSQDLHATAPENILVCVE